VGITLISDDRDLLRLCREALGEVQPALSGCSVSENFTPAWMLSVLRPCDARPDAGFCIWDFDAATVFPAWLDFSRETPGASKHLFLVDRENLGRFREATHRASVNILLKPVTRAVLTAFLDAAFAMGGYKDDEDDKPEPAHAGRDSAEFLLQTSLRLQKHNHERSDFIAGIAHDLRTPATSLLGYSGLLLDESQGFLDENQKTILRYMQQSADRFSRMASSIFELSVERRRERAVHLQTGDIAACLDQALHETGLLARDKRIAIRTQTEPFTGGLCFDRSLIERVLVNLLENACRFAPLNGTIEIRGYPFFWERRSPNVSVPMTTESRSSCRNTANSYRVDIENSGAAIPSGQLDSIFEQYVSAAPAGGRSGCGLGLAICRTIIARHQGRIWAENTDRGPRLSFVLPGGSPQVYPNRESRACERVAEPRPADLQPV
jgi:signal transduction histidine kinase